ncbi:hypothetical protein F53441_10392 [Fusarium austroafricanum]|uniref:SMODS and SLOG-associating 2TM effector domain-containing protein n=1 Tax=Fusarium austroafricanum TaxID=2364996 RepID=A0A8H4NVG2_9HYPO|nr:hypothetical protein F53441_10392 [Fusarium austroafricanum]
MSDMAQTQSDSPPRTIAFQDQEEEQTSTEKDQTPKKHEPIHYRFLSPSEWVIMARGVGGIRDVEQNAPVHPTNQFWPPKGIPPGLYRDCIYRRTISFYCFHLFGVVRAVFFVLQLMIGASLTALSSGDYDNTVITILAASNTVIAGLLALLHNSGVPDRYRFDKAEFERVEDHIRELLTTGLVRADQSVQEALAKCYDLFHHAKRTMEANMPATYVPGQILPDGQHKPPQPQPMPTPMPAPTKTHQKTTREPVTPPRPKSPKIEALPSPDKEKGPATKTRES